MRELFDRLDLRAKIALGFALLIALALVSDVASLLSHRQALAAVDAFLEHDARIAELALRSNAAMLKARRHEKDFLLKAREFSYEEAKSRYLTLLEDELASVRENMSTIRSLAGNDEITAQTLAIEQAALAFEGGFQEVVTLYGRLGRVDTGLEGELGRRAHALERLLGQGAPQHLTNSLLSMRRAEGEFLRHSAATYAEVFDDSVARFRADVGRAHLPAERRRQLLRLAGEYQALFHDYVTVDEVIGEASIEYLGAVHTIEPMLDRLHAQAAGAAAATRSTVERLGRRTAWTVATVGAMALLLGLAVAVLIFRNIARMTEDRRRIALALEHQATFDALTGLANRFTFEARLQQSVADARRRGNKLALMFIDLDRFKLVNDTLGHAVGDKLLSAVAHALAGTVRESDTVARLGGDEFVVLLRDVQTMADAAAVAGKILSALGEPLQIDGQEIRPSASVGVSLFPDDADEVSVVMRHADLAMYNAKSLGGGNFRFFAPEMNARLAERFAMEADLRRALERDELLVHYQPQVSLADGAVTGAEALVRWRHPVNGMVSPAQFIPLAEETGLVVPLGEWVIRNVCAQLRTWLDDGLPVPPVAVNLSARQFRQANLVALVEQTLADHALEPGLLALEVTESAVMHDVDAAVATMRQLKALGVDLAMDDFGTGYSSLSHLGRFPIDHLKIDQSFVRDITVDADHAVICNSIISLAHSLKLSVIAEGVETESQMQYLRRRRCDGMQGYLFSKPVPAQDFAELLRRDRRLALPGADEARGTIRVIDDGRPDPEGAQEAAAA